MFCSLTQLIALTACVSDNGNHLFLSIMFLIQYIGFSVICLYYYMCNCKSSELDILRRQYYSLNIA